MGGGFYCSTARGLRAENLGYFSKSSAEIFDQKDINSSMNPHGVNIRESRDSKEHPKSLAIVLALDVTGSMGSVPHNLVKTGLPSIMEGIIKAGIPDPQLLFLGIGDHECDRCPLQVGQFESSDELLDRWLTDLYLEGGGGGNLGESYLLAWYFSGKHTAIDCLEKRGEKGFLFTIGDEPVLKNIPKTALKELMGEGQYDNFDANVLLERAREKYHVYHLHIRETGTGNNQGTIDGWTQLLGDHLIVVERHTQVAQIIIDIVSKNVKTEVSKPSETGMIL